MLTGQLDGFAGAIAADKIGTEERLAALAERHQKDLGTLEAMLQAKLHTIETTVSKCDAVSKELQQAAFASAAAGLHSGALPPACRLAAPLGPR